MLVQDTSGTLPSVVDQLFKCTRDATAVSFASSLAGHLHVVVPHTAQLANCTARPKHDVLVSGAHAGRVPPLLRSAWAVRVQKVRNSACKALVAVAPTPHTWAVLFDVAQNSNHAETRRTAFACLAAMTERVDLPEFEPQHLSKLLKKGLTDEDADIRTSAQSFVHGLRQAAKPSDAHSIGGNLEEGTEENDHLKGAAQLVKLLQQIEGDEDFGAFLQC